MASSLATRVTRLEAARGGGKCPNCGGPDDPDDHSSYELVWVDEAEEEWCETCGRQTGIVIRWPEDTPGASKGGCGAWRIAKLGRAALSAALRRASTAARWRFTRTIPTRDSRVTRASAAGGAAGSSTPCCASSATPPPAKPPMGEGAVADA
jgi:hypothetical protein